MQLYFKCDKIKGAANEDIIINEGMVIYNLRFEALAPETDNALGVLNILLSDTMSSSERIEILDEKFDLDMSPDKREYYKSRINK